MAVFLSRVKYHEICSHNNMQNTDRRKKKYVYILPKNSYHKQKLL